VQPEAGNLAVAQRTAVALALADAVRMAVERHAPASALEARSRDVHKTFLTRPSPYVRRYGITSEGLEGSDFVVTLAADVAEEKVLADLRAMGLPVMQLAARPRVLVVALGGDDSTVAVQAVRRTLDAQGFVVRAYPGEPPAQVDEGVVAAWGRDLGCHVAFAVTAGPVSGEEQGEGQGPGEGDGVLNEGVKAAVRATGWAVDTHTGVLLGQAEGRALGWGEDAVAAAAVAARRAGGRLGNGLVAALEQSHWTPGDQVRSVMLEVVHIPGPAEVEALQRALPELTEVRSVALRAVGYHTATWLIAAVDSGQSWEAVVASVRLPRGRLAWVGGGLPAPGDPEVVKTEWTGP